MKGRLIYLSGIDGSGKTTVARALESKLRESGVRCTYSWLRRARCLSFPFLAFCYLVGYARSIKLKDGSRIGEYHFYKNRIVSYAWIWLTMADMWFLSLWKIYLPLLFGKVVLVDRYVFDAYVDLLADTKISRADILPLRLLLKLLPKKRILIMLDVDENIAMQRKKDILSKAYLSMRKESYHTVAKHFSIKIVNTSKLDVFCVINMVHQFILSS